jgi:hypothetical protein
LARAWYRSAAVSDPTHWGSDALARSSTRNWTSRERTLLRALLARIAASPELAPRTDLAP